MPFAFIARIWRMGKTTIDVTRKVSMAKKKTKQEDQLVHKKAAQLALKSKLTGPISELSTFQQSVLLAEVSMISYLTPEECNIAAGKLGFTDGKYFSCDGSQAYWFHNEFDSVVVFRGTEPNEWNDIRADANALAVLAETVGKVHRGFKKEVDDLWPYIEEALKDNKKPLWFTGHSLGGAMATICAGRCLLSHIRSEPEGLFSFGSPRVGDKAYVNHAKIVHYRWVNNNDIVARVPPVWMGYRHNGQEMYLNRNGRLKEISGWQRLSDRIQGFFQGLFKFRVDHLSDHSILQYIEHIYRLSKAEDTHSDNNKPVSHVGKSEVKPASVADKTTETEKVKANTGA